MHPYTSSQDLFTGERMLTLALACSRSAPAWRTRPQEWGLGGNGVLDGTVPPSWELVSDVDLDVARIKLEAEMSAVRECAWQEAVALIIPEAHMSRAHMLRL